MPKHKDLIQDFGPLAVDAFTCFWVGENNWWCPPIHLVPRVLRHVQYTRANGTFIFPYGFHPPMALTISQWFYASIDVEGMIELPISDP